MNTLAIDPFGQASCEQEISQLESGYSDIFFYQTPFNELSLEQHSYLIVGRRGSGKTALAKYFSFQDKYSFARCLEAEGRDIYQNVFKQLSDHDPEPRQFLITHLADAWETLVWSLILDYLCKHDSDMHKTLNHKSETSFTLNQMFEKLTEAIVPSNREAAGRQIELIKDDKRFDKAKKLACKICADKPLIVPIDTLEHYPVDNMAMMNTVAGLVQFAARFNQRYSGKGLYLKVFMAGEVFSRVVEGHLLNPLKSVSHPVHLLWRPRDLLRLICWRLFKHLDDANKLAPESLHIHNWDDYDEVHEKMWVPYFGRKLNNRRQLLEDTFPYVLRHTQMRPRQLIILCNSIANISVKEGRFPLLSEEDIRTGVRTAETQLASEIINAYDSVYPNAGTIIDACLKNCNVTFKGSFLDKRASEGAYAWPPGAYEQSKFREMVAALGVVGRVSRVSDAGYVDADFEYSSDQTLVLSARDDCVIHPMFYNRLKVNFPKDFRVMPFSTERS